MEFDAICTAEDVGSYKPADANFEYLLAHLKSDLGMDKADVLHTAQKPAPRPCPGEALRPRQRLESDRQRLSEGGNWGATEKVEAMPATDFVVLLDGEMAEAVKAEAD